MPTIRIAPRDYCYAICHNHTERWYSPTYASDMLDDECLVSPWQDDFNLSDVWHPSDMNDDDLPDADALNAHWVALTWADYADLCGIDTGE